MALHAAKPSKHAQKQQAASVSYQPDGHPGSYPSSGSLAGGAVGVAGYGAPQPQLQPQGSSALYEGKPRRRGVHPLVTILIAILALALGGVLGMFFLGDLIDRPQTPISSTITESQLDESVGSYTYQDQLYDITARQAIEDSVSLESVRNDDGTYDAPTADMVLSYARNRILASKVAEEGITVSEEELDDYLMQLAGTTDITQIANTYGMGTEQARTILTEAAGVKKLRDQVIGEVPTAPTAPQAPEDGDTETANADYATYIINLLGNNWDSSTGTWANTDNAFYTLLKDATFSADSANYEAATLAYYVAYQQYQSTTSSVSAAWTDYVNQFMVDGAVTVNTLLS